MIAGDAFTSASFKGAVQTCSKSDSACLRGRKCDITDISVC